MSRSIAGCVAVASVGCGLLVTFAPVTWIKAAAALALVLLLPGYVIEACWLQQSTRRDHDLWLLIPALSVAATILGGLVLAAAHHFDVPALAALLAAPTAMLAVFTGWRAPSAEKHRALKAPRTAHWALVAITAAFVLAMLAGAMTVSIVSARRDNARATSLALWALHGPGSLRVGASGTGQGPIVADVYVSSGGDAIASWSHVVLVPGGSWERTVTLDPAAASSAPITVQLKSGQRVLRSIRVRTENL